MIHEPLERSDAGFSAGTAAATVMTPAAPNILVFLRARLADYVVLGKTRVSILVLLVTAVGFCLGGPMYPSLLLHTLLGTGLVAFAANALNQYLERDWDRLMHRTADRPIPAGRIAPNEALVLGAAASLIGLLHLYSFTNLLATVLAAATIILYLFAYTPMKRRTIYNTWIGAVPGAMPPLIGFAAARGSLDALAMMLFAILFIWQLPHFYAIAWMYRDDYAAAGYRMLSVVDATGRRTGRQTVVLSVVLIAVSLLPSVSGYAGASALIGTAVLGAALVVVSVRMACDLSRVTASGMVLATVLYLPALMTLLLIYRASP